MNNEGQVIHLSTPFTSSNPSDLVVCISKSGVSLMTKKELAIKVIKEQPFYD